MQAILFSLHNLNMALWKYYMQLSLCILNILVAFDGWRWRLAGTVIVTVYRQNSVTNRQIPLSNSVKLQKYAPSRVRVSELLVFCWLFKLQYFLWSYQRLDRTLFLEWSVSWSHTPTYGDRTDLPVMSTLTAPSALTPKDAVISLTGRHLPSWRPSKSTKLNICCTLVCCCVVPQVLVNVCSQSVVKSVGFAFTTLLGDLNFQWDFQIQSKKNLLRIRIVVRDNM